MISDEQSNSFDGKTKFHLKTSASAFPCFQIPWLHDTTTLQYPASHQTQDAFSDTDSNTRLKGTQKPGINLRGES